MNNPMQRAIKMQQQMNSRRRMALGRPLIRRKRYFKPICAGLLSLLLPVIIAYAFQTYYRLAALERPIINLCEPVDALRASEYIERSN